MTFGDILDEVSGGVGTFSGSTGDKFIADIVARTLLVLEHADIIEIDKDLHSDRIEVFHVIGAGVVKIES